MLAASSFVAVVEPVAGQRVSSPLRVRGCSRTFESNVLWELRARDGRILASGHTSGGGISGAADFSFTADFSISKPEVGHLTVFEPDVSNGEGFPTGRTILPIVLVPGPQ
ncbi:MAG: Gmad2 immunoglobulin-like domain-containing protein [Deltaproteobacteria bacterium]|nr:Gmad2 immunoglobulin-like domain-containing protein [Deltaproteobacteria bacterium]